MVQKKPDLPFPRELTVGQVAARSGVAVSTLHFYEAKDLIKSMRSAGNQRRYPRDVLRKVAVIKIAQRVGIPLSAIKEQLDSLPQNRNPTAADWQRFSASWRDELNSRIRLLTGMRDQLDSCIGCGCLSLTNCPLRNPWDELAKLGPGPHFPSRE